MACRSGRMAESRVTSITAGVLAPPVSQVRITSVPAEVLGTASSKVRVSSLAAEALVSVADRASPPRPRAPLS